MATLPQEWDDNIWLEIGKTDNGNVVVTTHRLGARSLADLKSAGVDRGSDKTRQN